MNSKLPGALTLQDTKCIKNLLRSHAIFCIPRIIHNIIADLEHSTRIITAANDLRNLSNSFLYTLNMSDVIKIIIPPISSAYLNSLSGVSLEENIMSPFLHPIALESISSVMDEQSHPQPYSCRILIRNGFGVAFTAKNSLKPLFHAKASFKPVHFPGCPSHHKDEMGWDIFRQFPVPSPVLQKVSFS